ncbi:MAG: RNA polymerase sigma factor [Gemmataceae bacterium]|jgi:RNA polymerase sigma-70 factor (ECF subfamily)
MVWKRGLNWCPMSAGPNTPAAEPSLPEPLDSDAALTRLARAGDRAAWGALAARHYEPIFRWLWRVSGRHEVAEDLAQDAFLRAATRMELFHDGTHFRAWLFRIAHNLWANHCRSSARRRAGGLEEAAEVPDAGLAAIDPVQQLGDREEIDVLKERLQAVPREWREALLLRAEGELSFRDIAEVQGITEETARWRVFKARKELAAMASAAVTRDGEKIT